MDPQAIVFVSGARALGYDPGEDFGLPVTYTPVATGPSTKTTRPRRLVKVALLRVRVQVSASVL